MRLPLVLLLCAAAATAQIRFREVAADRGLKFTLENNPTERKHLIETMTGGVAAFDADGDGFTDVFFVNGAAVPSLDKSAPKFHNRLFRNVEGRSFTDVTDSSGLAGVGYAMGVAAADFDNDGDQDLFVAGVGRNRLYSNRGDGVFDDVTAISGIKDETWSVAALWLDFDNDGRLDLWVVNYLDWTPEFDTYCGDQPAGVRSYCHPRLFEGLSDTLYRNLGDGKFEDISKSSGVGNRKGKGMSAAAADFDDDGYLDVFVTNDKEASFLWRNNGDGTFEEVGLLVGGALPDSGNPVSAMGVDFRDYDNDGLPDIAYTALRGERTLLFRNEGEGLIIDAGFSSGLGRLSVDASGWGVGLYDFDNDGRKDLFTANSHVNDTVAHFEPTEYLMHNRVYHGASGGKFQPADASGFHSAPPRAHRGAAFLDYNQDGRVDIVVSSLSGAAELWENVSAPNAWLTIDLQGSASNRDGIGARVRVDDQHNHATQAVGYASSSDLLHFGLGAAQTAREVEILWPSGQRQLLHNVSANRRLTVREPQ